MFRHVSPKTQITCCECGVKSKDKEAMLNYSANLLLENRNRLIVTTKTSKSVIRSPGFPAGVLLVLLISSLTPPSFPQEASWPEPSGVSGLKQQLATSEAKKGKDHPDLVEILYKLADAYANEGGYVLAAPYVERALSVAEKTHGSESLEVGATLDKLGTLYLYQGDIARARTAYVRAGPILFEKLGQNNPGYG